MRERVAPNRGRAFDRASCQAHPGPDGAVKVAASALGGSSGSGSPSYWIASCPSATGWGCTVSRQVESCWDNIEQNIWLLLVAPIRASTFGSSGWISV